AVVILVILSAAPLLKLLILLFLYRTAAGILQPVGDKRLVACIESVAEGQKMLLGLAAAGLLLFSVTIGLVCAGTNGAYLGI
ncbi:MAG: sporulation protein, partial [Lachnospiraceae bacterium]|nr:sporulation protein [Lachnospiraceae bacterium]